MTPEEYQAVSEIFGEATERPPGKRLKFVEQACRGDARLKREVTSLLHHHEDRIDEALGASKNPEKQTGRSKIGIRWRQSDDGRGRRLALTALIAACVFAVIGVLIHGQVDRIQRRQMNDELTTVLEANVAAVSLWVEDLIKTTERWAIHPHLIDVAKRLAVLDSNGMTVEELLASDENARFLEILTPVGESPSVRGMHLLSVQGRVLGSTPVEGRHQSARLKPIAFASHARILDGDTVFTPPYMEHSHVENVESLEKVPIVNVKTRVVGPTGEPLGIFGFRWRVDEDFARLFALARLGQSGETYAFDKDGVVISNLRDEAHLRELGIIDPEAPAGTALNVSLRDPGGDLAAGFQPDLSRPSLPLTRMAAQATAGIDGVDLKGYRDFAGRKVVGAWRWLPGYGFGVVAEIGYNEAYAATHSVRNIFLGLFGVLLVTAGFAFTKARLNLGLRQELDRIRAIGPYQIEYTIAEGGMGTVYRATHNLLKRPTAIKVIRPDKVSQKAIQRFESEVRSMSRLTHPNTTQVYDYAIQPDGSLYYAMEYLDGLTLAELSEKEGPLPWRRAVHTIRQVCLSLREAHDQGILHRDIKPQNIMICVLGGQRDFVKVLDFGLVKELGGIDSTTTTIDGSFAGTPLYMAPERMRNPQNCDVRGEVYSLGCLGFYLLTGTSAFQGVNVLDTCFRVMTEKPPKVSDRIDDRIPSELETLLSDCLAADPASRPQSMTAVLSRLDQVAQDPSREDRGETSQGRAIC